MKEDSPGHNANDTTPADTDVLEKEVIVETYRASGPGGQRRDKKETAVRLTHIPTGISVVASERRSQALNREIAFHRLREKLEELHRPETPRIETIPPPAAEKRRLESKRRRSERKRQRAAPEVSNDDAP